MIWLGVLYPACAGLAWLGLVCSLVSERSPGNSAVLPVRLGMGCLAVTFTVSSPGVWARLDSMAGFPNLAALVAHLAVLGYVAAAQVLLLRWTNPPDQARALVRRRLIWLAVLGVVLISLFVAAPRTPERPRGFVISVAGQPVMTVYLLLYLTAFAFTQAEVGALGVRYASVCANPWLRRGLRNVALGAVLGEVYCLIRYSDLVLAHTAPGAMTEIEALAGLSAGIGEIFNLVGWTMPIWGQALSEQHGLISRYRDYQRLGPLWRALVQACPYVTLDPVPPRFADLLAVSDLSYRLQRRIIEIRDAQLALSPRRDHWVVTTAEAEALQAGLTDVDHAAYVEARVLRAALHSDDAPPTSPTGMSSASIAGPPQDQAAETAWLVRVALAFQAIPRTRRSRRLFPLSLGQRS